jgi:LysM repeat protein
MLARVAQLPCLFLLVLLAAALPAADSRYTIKEGETLFSVARRAQVPVDVLSGYNGVADAGKVKTGTVLRIPTGYMVKKGDTLYSIARTFSVPIGRLLELNKLGQNARLRIGERIFIPQDPDPLVSRGADPVQKPPRGDAPLATDAVSPRLGTAVVWPHAGRHEMDNGKIPGLVFYGAAGDVVRAATAGEVKWAAT